MIPRLRIIVVIRIHRPGKLDLLEIPHAMNRGPNQITNQNSKFGNKSTFPSQVPDFFAFLRHPGHIESPDIVPALDS